MVPGKTETNHFTKKYSKTVITYNRTKVVKTLVVDLYPRFEWIPPMQNRNDDELLLFYRVAEILDYTADELTGMNMYTLCHGEDVSKLRKCHLDRKYTCLGATRARRAVFAIINVLTVRRGVMGVRVVYPLSTTE